MFIRVGQIYSLYPIHIGIDLEQPTSINAVYTYQYTYVYKIQCAVFF